MPPIAKVHGPTRVAGEIADVPPAVRTSTSWPLRVGSRRRLCSLRHHPIGEEEHGQPHGQCQVPGVLPSRSKCDEQRGHRRESNSRQKRDSVENWATEPMKRLPSASGTGSEGGTHSVSVWPNWVATSRLCRNHWSGGTGLAASGSMKGMDEDRPMSIFGVHGIEPDQLGMFNVDGDPHTVMVFGDIESGEGDWVAVAVGRVTEAGGGCVASLGAPPSPPGFKGPADGPPPHGELVIFGRTFEIHGHPPLPNGPAVIIAGLRALGFELPPDEVA